jgi:hypothetical protein
MNAVGHSTALARAKNSKRTTAQGRKQTNDPTAGGLRAVEQLK